MYDLPIAAQFNQQHLLTLTSWSPEEIGYALEMALRMKKNPKAASQWLADKFLVCIFAKPSLRTRVSFEAGMAQLGGRVMTMTEGEIGLGVREPVPDIAKVLSRMADGIMIRTFEQETVVALAKHGSIPVINGLTDAYHPCQALADILTFLEIKGGLKGKKLAFVGDGNNVAASLLIISAKLGLNIAIGHAPGYAPDADVIEAARKCAEVSGAVITLTTDPAEAVAGADAVYADIWASMGQESQRAARMRDFANYRVTNELMGKAKPDAIFLHCLPAHRGEEVTTTVIDGEQSRVFDQAENRLHAQKAVLALLLGGKRLDDIG